MEIHENQQKSQIRAKVSMEIYENLWKVVVDVLYLNVLIRRPLSGVKRVGLIF